MSAVTILSARRDRSRRCREAARGPFECLVECADERGLQDTVKANPGFFHELICPERWLGGTLDQLKGESAAVPRAAGRM